MQQAAQFEPAGIGRRMFTKFARLKTRLFRAARPTTIIIGTNAVTRLLSRDLESAGGVVSLIDLDDRALADSKAEDHSVLSSAGAKGARCVLAATGNDGWNLSLAQVARIRFHVPTVVTRLKLLGEVSSWARLSDAGMVRMSCGEMVSAVMGTVPPGGGLALVAGATEREHVAEVELLTPVFPGQTIPNLNLNGCKAIALRRNSLWVDDIDLVELRRGDLLTLVGAKRALHKVRESFTSL